MFTVIVKFFTILSPILQRMGICSTTGFIAGAFTGFMLWIYASFQAPSAYLSAADIVGISLLLAAAAWLIILFAFIALARISFMSIWHSSLFNVIITCLLTVWIVYSFNLWIIAYLIGMLIGLWVGFILCYINNYLKKTVYGMHR